MYLSVRHNAIFKIGYQPILIASAFIAVTRLTTAAGEGR